MDVIIHYKDINSHGDIMIFYLIKFLTSWLAEQEGVIFDGYNLNVTQQWERATKSEPRWMPRCIRAQCHAVLREHFNVYDVKRCFHIPERVLDLRQILKL